MEKKSIYSIADSDVDSVDFLLSTTRDKRAARRPLRKALASQHNRMPGVVSTDKYPATEVAIAEELHMGVLDSSGRHGMCQHLNNTNEQDHGFIKRRTGPMLGFKRFRAAYFLIGIETMHMLRKCQVGYMIPSQEADFIRRIMVVA